MRAFVTGVNGQLGHDVMLELLKRGYIAIGSGSGAIYKGDDAVAECPYEQMDITDDECVRGTLWRLQPDAVIHCSAWTAVDAAEDEKNREMVRALNVKGPGNIAGACTEIGAKMVYLSTDYVFNGQGTRPWKPDEREYAPVNYYGQTKMQGEIAVSSALEEYFIVRTAWVFGIKGHNFIKTMLDVGKGHDSVRVVDDQIGTPTYTKDLARLLVDMIETERYGYYHATNSETEPGGYISWADLAEEAYRAAGMKTKVIRVSTEEYGLAKAVRPYNSRLDKSKLVESGFTPLPQWKDAVRRYIEEAGLKA